MRWSGPVGIRTPDYEVSPVSDSKASEASRPILARLQALHYQLSERIKRLRSHSDECCFPRPIMFISVPQSVWGTGVMNSSCYVLLFLAGRGLILFPMSVRCFTLSWTTDPGIIFLSTMNLFFKMGSAGMPCLYLKVSALYTF